MRTDIADQQMSRNVTTWLFNHHSYFGGKCVDVVDELVGCCHGLITSIDHVARDAHIDVNRLSCQLLQLKMGF